MPEEVFHLFALARLAQACKSLGIAKIDAGPQAVALTFRDGAATTGFDDCDERLSWRGERLILAQPSEHAEQRLREADLLLRKLSRRRGQ
jgi:transcription-repair coupling factor (superfamily II helicase)